MENVKKFLNFRADRAFWLTGSQIFKLMRGVQESLAGRVAVLSMTSLSQAELCGAAMEPFCLELDGVLNPIEIKKTSNPGTELTKVFSLLDRASVPGEKGAVVCMKPQVGVIDRDNYVVPVWTI